MIVTERVLFKMPKDPELVFPAMAVVQDYINGYDEKMHDKLNDGSLGKAQWRLEYGFANLRSGDWAMFQAAGLELKQQPGFTDKDGELDMVVDMSDEKLAQFLEQGKHACQVAAMLAGVECKALPIVRQIKPKVQGAWYMIDGAGTDYATLSVPEILHAEDDTITGIIGNGWPMYLAASMGLPVLEIITKDRPPTWLSKWANGGYRMLREDSGVSMTLQLQRSITSVEQMLYRRSRNVPYQQKDI